MTIELKISVNHATDLAAEVQTLATIFGVASPTEIANAKLQSQYKPEHAERLSRYEIPVGTCSPEPSKKEETTPTPPTGTIAEKITKAEKTVEGAKKTLNRKEQDEAVAEMVKSGVKDDRFEMLTKGRQNEVEAALEKAAAPTEKTDSDLDDMFSEDTTPARVVTREMVSELMGKIGKDKDGNPVQERLLKMRAILVDHIPEGQDIKVRNIPEEKLAVVFDAIEKVV